MADLSDDELLLMFRNGAPEAFDALFDRYRASVYNFACAMLRDPEKAEDVLQETFLAVVRAAKRYEPRGRFRVWLMRIARNRCLNWIQSQRVRRAVIAEIDLHVIEPAAAAPPPVQQAVTHEEMRMVRDAIQRLPERQREAIVLYAFESMAYREIAEVLNMPINTVKTLIHRARARLARALDQATKERGNVV